MIETVTKPTVSSPFLKWTEQLSFLFFCVFLFDCSFSGSGRFLEFAGLTPRILLAVLSLLLILPTLLRQLPQLLRQPVIPAFLLFGIYLVVCALRGYAADNLRSVLISDIKGFLWLVLIPIAMLTVTDAKRLRLVLSCIVAGSVGQVLFVFIFNGICAKTPGFIHIVHDDVIASGIGSISQISRTIYRIFMKSCPYMVLACCILLFRQLRRQRVNWASMVLAGCLLCACLLSYTRSLYLCIFAALVVAVILLLALYPKAWRRWMLCLLAASLSFALCTFAMEQIFDGKYTAFALHRTIGTPFTDDPAPVVDPDPNQPSPEQPGDFDPSDPSVSDPLWDPLTEYESQNLQSTAIRQKTEAELMALIRQAPVFGNGLGAHAPSRNGPDEYFYLDVLARMGIVGLVLYILPFGLILAGCIRNRKKLLICPDAIAILCGMAGFWAVTYFNPWMNAALGIAAYAICCAIPGILKTSDETVINTA